MASQRNNHRDGPNGTIAAVVLYVANLLAAGSIPD